MYNVIFKRFVSSAAAGAVAANDKRSFKYNIIT